MRPGATDEELMLAYRAGDAAAFDLLYMRHKGGVFRYLRRQTGNAALADELFQDVWLRLVDARGRYEPQAKFATWLYTIAHNRLMDHFRAGRRAQLASYEDPDNDPVADLPAHDPPPEDTLARKQEAARLLAAIDALPAPQREAFVLQQEGDLSVEEIANATGVTRETAKSRLRYALAKLRASLRPRSANDETAGAESEPG
jgi:RNA polymerase sigma-70 factor (ECF subfamily)